MKRVFQGIPPKKRIPSLAAWFPECSNNDFSFHNSQHPIFGNNGLLCWCPSALFVAASNGKMAHRLLQCYNRRDMHGVFCSNDSLFKNYDDASCERKVQMG